MATLYDAAVSTLYQAPHDTFVAERKRLASELKQSGEKAAATRFAKLGRPSISAWAVNQLWWQEQGPFAALLGAAARMRAGDRAAMAAHREALATLRARAAALLGAAGHALTDATLRRVATTLSALAAAGGFDPDPPGALVSDRDPPGFDVVAMTSAGPGAAPAVPGEAGASGRTNQAESVRPPPVLPPPPAARQTPANDTTEQPPTETGRAPVEALQAEQARAERVEAERVEAERVEAERVEAERRRSEAERRETERRQAERARRQKERERLGARLQTAKAELETQSREFERLRSALDAAAVQVESARAVVAELEAHLAEVAD